MYLCMFVQLHVSAGVERSGVGGDMARLEKEHSGVMGDEGERVRIRRERLNMGKVELAESAGVSRDTLAAIEEGKGFRRSSLTKIEHALERAEEEAGIVTPPNHATTSSDDLVEFRVEGIVGVAAVVVRGPVRDIEKFEGSIARILRQMQHGEATSE